MQINRKTIAGISVLLLLLTLILVMKEVVIGIGFDQGIIVGAIVITPFALAILLSAIILLICVWRSQS